MAFVRLSNMPAPAAERVCSIPSMAGGINLHDRPAELREDQSPEMINLWWKDGLLCSRPAQAVFAAPDEEGESGCACYGQLYHGHYVFHRGHKMWAVSEDGQTVTALDVSDLRYQSGLDQEGEPIIEPGLPDVYGSFVLHSGILYYKTKDIFAVIDENLQVREIEPFRPTYLINADPSAAGAGDLYQPLNRLSRSFYVTYSPAEDETEDFHVPVFDCAVSDVEVLDDDGTWVEVEYKRHRSLKHHTFYVSVTDPTRISRGQNNVRLTCHLSSSGPFAEQYAQIMSCRLATVYGGGEGLCMVLGGCEAQPNAWFWSANTDLSMDPTYFPEEHYNLAGDFSDPITAFGLQQNKLIIFQKTRIGAAEFGTADIDGRTFITMDYRTVSPYIGCDVPGSVQLVENNLVFANRDRGVFLLRDTTAAGENTLAHISDNVERTGGGLLYDLRQAGAAVSMDDGQRYWLLLGEHAWLWDYRLGGAVGSPRNLSWFFWNGLRPAACAFGENGVIGRDGVLYRFADDGSELFESLLTLPVRHFGTYAVKKDVGKVLFSLDGSAEGAVAVEYVFDRGSRQDPSPLMCKGEESGFDEVFVRKPRCLDVSQFFCRLRTMGKLAFRSAQVHYVFRGEDR